MNIEEHVSPGDVSGFLSWYSNIQGTTRDIYQFYAKTIIAIKEVDPTAVIMLDAGWYAQPGAFCYWPEKFNHSDILYSFHMYEPYEFTSNKNFKKGEITFPFLPARSFTNSF